MLSVVALLLGAVVAIVVGVSRESAGAQAAAGGRLSGWSSAPLTIRGPVSTALGGAQAQFGVDGAVSGGGLDAGRVSALAGRLPRPARGLVSGVLGAGDRRFWVGRAGGGLAAANIAQGFAVRFSRFGVELAAGSQRVSLALAGVGFGDQLRGLAPVAPVATRNRVSIAYDALSEWYVNGPLGLEQGFTLRSRSAGAQSGALTVALRLGGSLRPRLERGGEAIDFLGPGGGVVLRYVGLEASDARGRALRAWLVLRSGRLLIRVDARGARYPLRIDPFVQQGSKLVGSDAVGASYQGYSVALSGDGNTALIGGPFDNGSVGAVWVFTRSGTTWTQQGLKLTADDETGAGEFGFSVALSADGNTALIGGDQDNSPGAAEPGVGAVWVFTRSGTTWTQQGSKLIGTGASGDANQGWSVALSSDGNTALVGGPADNDYAGAAWVFTRSGTTWTQQGKKLVGTGAVGAAEQGYSVALSGDGQTALLGGIHDNTDAGAAWVFTRSGTTWTQQGKKLVGTGASSSGYTLQGRSVALSGDGDTALVGGDGDNNDVGAVWVFTRSGTTWSQQGKKLVGTGASGAAVQGFSVALSSDGNTALVGGRSDDNDAGAVWVFTRSGTTWSQQGSKLVGTGASGAADQGWSVALSSDGSTALVGGDGDNNNVGAAWTFGSLDTLSVSLAGTGKGGVSGSGISCPRTCSRNYAGGTVVRLSAKPSAGSSFAGWSGGGCSGTGTCTVTMSANRDVTASFRLLPPGTTITNAKISSKHHQATFSFTATGTATGFQCSLVKGPEPTFKACKSPKTYELLKPGKYTFEVRAFNAGGADPTPAKKSFTIT